MGVQPLVDLMVHMGEPLLGRLAMKGSTASVPATMDWAEVCGALVGDGSFWIRRKGPWRGPWGHRFGPLDASQAIRGVFSDWAALSIDSEGRLGL